MIRNLVQTRFLFWFKEKIAGIGKKDAEQTN